MRWYCVTGEGEEDIGDGDGMQGLKVEWCNCFDLLHAYNYTIIEQ